MTTQPRPQLPADDVTDFLVDAFALIRQRHELADLCALLVTTARRFLPLSASAVVLVDEADGPRIASVVARSDSGRRHIESDLAGNAISECLQSGTSVTSNDSTIHALPISSHDSVFGALVLVADDELTAHHLAVAGLLTDVATVAFLQTSPHLLSASIRARFNHLVQSLDVIEQAKGMLSQRHGVNVDVAFEGLWQVGLDHGINLSALAELVVRRSLDPEVSAALELCLTRPASAPAE